VAVNECASHAAVLAAIGPSAGKGSGEQSLARGLYPRLEGGWLLIADRNFYSWADWCTAADSGAALLWRVKANLGLPVLELLPDGSYRSVLLNPQVSGAARKRLAEAARNGEDLDPARARHVRVTEYEVPDRDGLRGPGKILRSRSPDMIEQELWGCLLTRYAISALACTAATAAGIDPDPVRPKRTIRAVRRRVADPAFPP
jgi:hypothetical protein